LIAQMSLNRRAMHWNPSTSFNSLLLACLTILSVSNASLASTLRIGTQGSIPSLDPHVLNETFTLGILSNVMEGLVRRDAQLRIQPGLATRWERQSPLLWRFHLRRGVQFHDGSPFSADDVLFSFARARQPLSQQKHRIPNGARLKKVDAHTIDVHLARPSPMLHADWEPLLILSKSWAEKHGMEKAGATPGAGGGLPANGTGPYRIVRHRPGMSTKFSANSNWWRRSGQTPDFDQIVLHTVNGAQTRTAALLSGQLDLIVPAPIGDLDRIERTAGFKILTGPELRTIFLNMDQMRETLVGASTGTQNPLRDRRVRRAIYHAINAEAIVRVIMRGRAVVASSLVSPLVHPDVGTIKRFAYDPARAKALLSEAGYGGGFVLPMDCPADRYVNDRPICEAIAGMLMRVGIRVRLNVQTKSLFFAKVLSGGGYNSAFNLIGWTPGDLDGLNVLTHIAHCRDAAGNGAHFNLGGYCNARVDALTASAQAENDTGRRTAMISKAFQIIHEDTGFVPLHQQKLAWAMSDKIKARARADNQIRFTLIGKHHNMANARH
jgi:peptide/nickel transport system substrate-binding protein